MGCSSSQDKGAPAGAVVKDAQATAPGAAGAGIPELIYFGAPGRGEIARLAYKFKGVEFTDTRISFADWPKIKDDAKSAPAKAFAAVPVVAREEYLLAQSVAVAQHAYDTGVAANKEEMSPQQRALDMMMLGVHADMQAAMYACLFGDDASKTKGMADLSGKVTPFLEGLERLYQSKDAFIYRAKASGPSLGDIAVYNLVESPFPGLKALKFDVSKYPSVMKVVQAVKEAELEKVVQWVSGVAVPFAITRGFYNAVAQSDAEATRYLERPSVPEFAKVALKPEIKAGAAAELKSRWGAKAVPTAPERSDSPKVSGKPELTYFSGPGRAELTRLAFAAGSVDYDCVRISPDDWPSVKADQNRLPAQLFGSMPVLKHGDFSLAQSMAVAQYAADIGMNAAKPPTVDQRGLDTMMLGAHADLQKAMYSCLFGDDESKAKGKADLSGKVTPILQGIERFYTGVGPYLYSPAEAGPSLGDLALLDVVTSPFPGLKALEFDLTPFNKVTSCVSACEGCSKGTLKTYLDSRGKKE